MHISNYLKEEDKKAPNERKWHNYAKNFIMCSDCKKCMHSRCKGTDSQKEDK